MVLQGYIRSKNIVNKKSGSGMIYCSLVPSIYVSSSNHFLTIDEGNLGKWTVINLMLTFHVTTVYNDAQGLRTTWF